MTKTISVSYVGEHDPKLDKELEKAMKSIGFEDVGAVYSSKEQVRKIDYER